ncbi:MAG: hypothetical protein A3J38_09005 [Gammaproteobacteria bacterium RIFCSPHIGHO2_12_FULL_45_9]|nr:MAG: hypothetical protein A3J38_09005 [Gammaproteobacteria bacterium RIFCSPHIGHO2_12_FULL_45_9]
MLQNLKNKVLSAKAEEAYCQIAYSTEKVSEMEPLATEKRRLKKRRAAWLASDTPSGVMDYAN